MTRNRRPAAGRAGVRRATTVRVNELKLALPATLVQALDRYAHTQGLSREQAVQAALCSGPIVATVMCGGDVSMRDVVGP